MSSSSSSSKVPSWAPVAAAAAVTGAVVGAAATWMYSQSLPDDTITMGSSSASASSSSSSTSSSASGNEGGAEGRNQVLTKAQIQGMKARIAGADIERAMLIELQEKHQLPPKVPDGVLINATQSHFEYPRDIRQAKTDPLPEIEGDAFDRQRVIEGWDEAHLEKQKCLVLGTGGLGQSVAFALCRLGVDTVMLLDRDSYDASNLNRQILGGVSDVGRRKVDVAKDRLLASHAVRTKIETFHGCALKNWGKIVSMARRADVIFNCIDYGSTFDFAVNSLCKALKIPYVSGSSYSFTINAECYDGQSGTKCWNCNNGANVKDAFSQNKATAEALKLWGAGGDESKVDPSTEYTPEQVAAFLAESIDMLGPRAVELVTEALNGKSSLSAANEDEFKSFMLRLHDVTLRAAFPDKICDVDDLSWFPKSPHFPTRNVGSWVCVCTGAALEMVNLYVQKCVVRDEDYQVPRFLMRSLLQNTVETDIVFGGNNQTDDECLVCKSLSGGGDGEAGAGAAAAGAAGSGSKPGAHWRISN